MPVGAVSGSPPPARVTSRKPHSVEGLGVGALGRSHRHQWLYVRDCLFLHAAVSAINCGRTKGDVLKASAISSDDLLADRRYRFGRDLAARGDDAGAADLFAQAIEAAPGFAPAWFALGDVRARLGDEGPETK